MAKSEQQKHVAYISNICEFCVPCPFELMPGFFLRKAARLERDFISELLRNFAGEDFNPHEYRWTFTHGSGASRLMNPEEWLYHVIEFPADFPWIQLTGKSRREEVVSDIFFDATSISEANLHCHILATELPDLHRKGPPLMVSPQHLSSLHSQLLHDLAQRQCVRTVTEAQLLDIQKAFEQMKRLGGEQSLIRDVISRYQQSFTIYATSALRVLAQFGTIELLMTHKPQSTETGDSLSRQLRTKLPLVAKRFSQPLTPTEFFGFEGKAKAKEWDILYELRSRIAHDGPIQIAESVKSNKLGSVERVSFFLDDFTRRLIRQALVDPELFIDLKKC